MTAARFYSSTAGAMELQSGITSSATTMLVDTTTGLPGTTPFTLVIDPGTSTEEILDVTAVAGTTLTISRGVDGSPAQAHSAGAAIRHMATARDFRDAQEHIGFTQNVHGIGSTSSVVGTATVQTLTNKTAQAGSAATVGLYVKGFASQTAPYMDVQDAASTSVVTVVPGQDSFKVAGTTGINTNGAAGIYHYVAKFTASDSSAVAVILKAAASQTADLFQVQNSSGTVLAKFDSGGNLTAPGATIGGSAVATLAAAQTLTNKTLTSPVTTGLTGTTGTFTGQVQSNSVNVVTLSETQTLTSKTLTAPATTGLTGDTGAFTGNVTAANLTATSTKAGKKQHWGFKASQALTGSGDATFTHGAGFTPQAVIIQPVTVGLSWSVDNITSTTFDVHFRLSAGGSYTTATSFSFFCGE